MKTLKKMWKDIKNGLLAVAIMWTLYFLYCVCVVADLEARGLL